MSKELKTFKEVRERKRLIIKHDEFVKAQGTPVYHGTNLKFNAENIKPSKGTQGTGIYLDLKKDTAIKYAKGGDVFEFVGQDLKLADTTKFTKEQSRQFSEAYEKAVKQLGEHSDEATNMAYKSMGFDGKKITDTEIMLFDNSQIKTRSQLTDIWNKANKTPETSLIQEARKYNSAEEFVKAVENESNIGQAGKFETIPINKIRGTDYVELDSALKNNKKLTLEQVDEFLPDNEMMKVKNKVVMPIEVVKNTDGTYSLMAGNHRVAQQFINGEQSILANISNEKGFSTKSQLTDIWNKANKICSKEYGWLGVLDGSVYDRQL